MMALMDDSDILDYDDGGFTWLSYMCTWFMMDSFCLLLFDNIMIILTLFYDHDDWIDSMMIVIVSIGPSW